MNDWIPFLVGMLAVGFFCVYVLYSVFADDCEQYRLYTRVRKWDRTKLTKVYK